MPQTEIIPAIFLCEPPAINFAETGSLLIDTTRRRTGGYDLSVLSLFCVLCAKNVSTGDICASQESEGCSRSCTG